jgi:hypothetical protein
MLHRLEAQSQGAAWRRARRRPFLTALDRIVAVLYRCGDMGPTGEDTMLEPWMTVSVAPPLVSNRDMVACSEQGARGVLEDIVEVTVTTARTSVRLPVPPELAKGSVALIAAPAPRFVIAVALPMVAPLAFTNEIEPLHEAAVPLLALEARFTTSTSAVWVDPNPTTGKFMEELTVSVVVVVCAHPQVAVTTKRENTTGLVIFFHLLRMLSRWRALRTRTLFST